MIKREEIKDPASCLNRAADEEFIFTLLGRDAAAPAAIRFWCEERIRLGKNVATDVQIGEAYLAAAKMESERAKASACMAVDSAEPNRETKLRELSVRLWLAGLDFDEIVAVLHSKNCSWPGGRPLSVPAVERLAATAFMAGREVNGRLPCLVGRDPLLVNGRIPADSDSRVTAGSEIAGESA